MAKNHISMSIIALWLLALVVGMSGCARLGGTGVIRVEALAGGAPIVESSPSDPIPLEPDEQLELTLLITNVTSIPVDIGSVELEGRVLGLEFLSLRTGLDETLQPGEERLIRFPVDLYGVDRQARGLLRGRVVVSSPEGVVHASQPVVFDGRGGVLAATSLLAFALFAVGVIALGVVAVRSFAGSLPEERRLRGLHFVPAGVAFGLALSVMVSVVRIWPLTAPTWLLVTAVLSLVFYVVGVYSPAISREQRLERIDLTAGGGEPISISSVAAEYTDHE